MCQDSAAGHCPESAFRIRILPANSYYCPPSMKKTQHPKKNCKNQAVIASRLKKFCYQFHEP